MSPLLQNSSAGGWGRGESERTTGLTGQPGSVVGNGGGGREMD